MPCKQKPDFILPLSDASAGLSLVGGKGASLARLAAAGLARAPWFSQSPRPPIANSVANVDCKSKSWRLSPPSIPISLRRSKRHPAGSTAFFAQYAMPDEIAEAIRRAYAGLVRDVRARRRAFLGHR